MNSTRKLFGSVMRTEMLKIRHTVAFWLTILYPLGTVILASLFLYAMRKNADTSGLPFINNLNNVAAFFLPFYAVLTISFFCQIEQRNNMLKHLFALPVPKWAYYYGKLFSAFLLMFVAWLLLIVFTYISLGILGMISPALRITQQFDHAYLFTVITRSFLSSVALAVMQYLLSLRLKNVVAPVAIGTAFIILPIAVLFVLGVTGLISNPTVLQWLPKYDPYSYPFSFVFSMSNGGLVKLDFFPLSLAIWMLIALALAIAGYFEIRSRNIR